MARPKLLRGVETGCHEWCLNDVAPVVHLMSTAQLEAMIARDIESGLHPAAPDQDAYIKRPGDSYDRPVSPHGERVVGSNAIAAFPSGEASHSFSS
jgi:hypothetical protein